MNYFLKYIHLILGFNLNLLFSETSLLDSVIHKLYAQPGMYRLEIEQLYSASQSRSNADLFIDNQHHLMIRMPNVTLLLDDNLFYTFYPRQNKVVIDHYIKNEFNLISILNGDWKNITVDRVEEKPQSKTIYLSIEDYEISGNLEVDKYYDLRNLSIYFSENESINLSLDLINLQSTEFTKVIPDTTGWEIIDFHE